ncbi:VCBS repeat-containing protein [Pendulispora rubella]|uniref:VCBS repeat-containing protein n=1 Tax=Pendulispora rubella TaxID=2741070 RepID=A0ABZ2LE86_9BACT
MKILQRLGALLVLGTVCLASCQTLPDTGACGNGVVEVQLGEVCDGTSTLAGTVCNAACQYACVRGADASDGVGKCPGGYYCGADSVCRAPSGQFARDDNASMASDADRIDVADVDDDGSLDLIATSTGFTRVHFFSGGKFSEVTLIPNKGSTAPIVAPLTGDARTDLLFPSQQISVWQGLSDRTLEPIQYPSLVLSGAGARDAQSFVADTHATFGTDPSPGDETYLFRPKPGGGSDIELERGLNLTPVQTLRGPADQVAGEVQVGDIDGDNCPDAVYGFLRRSIGSGTPGVDLFFPCKAIPGGVLPSAPLPATEPAIRFPSVPGRPSARYVVGERGVLLADFDGDDKLDVLVHAEMDTDNASDRASFAAILLAYGVGDGRFQSTPPHDSVTGDGMAAILDGGPLDFPKARGAVIFPLAAEQLTNRGSNPDKLADFVFPEQILLRTKGFQDGGSVRNVKIPAPGGIIWREALVGNFNTDGFFDILAGSENGFDFYSGTQDPSVMTPFPFSVPNGAQNFAVGDFDGDRTNDVAFSSSNELFVAFGTQSGPNAPTSMGRFPSIEHVEAGKLAVPGQVPDGLADLAVIGTDTGESNAPFLALLTGSISRKLVAPLRLHVEGTPATVVDSLMAAAGVFDTTSRGLDMAAIGEPLAQGDVFTLWNIPLTGDARVITNSVSQRGFNLSALGGAVATDVDWASAATAAMDLDAPAGADALDELIIAVPPKPELDSEQEDITRGGALIVGRLGNGTWATQSMAVLGGGKGTAKTRFKWKLRVTDVDDDKVKDLVALYFQDGAPKLQVFFNDRTGNLGEPLTIDVPGQRIVDCAWMRADELSTDENKKDLVVLTIDDQRRYGLFLVKSDKAKRGFLPAKSVADLGIRAEANREFRASIAAGDVTADGVDDIVVSAANAVTLFRGRPR